MTELQTRDHVWLDDGLVFGVKGDQHPNDTTIGVPLFAPDHHGERYKDGQRYAAIRKTGHEKLGKERYELLNLHDRLHVFPDDAVDETISPFDDTDQIAQHLDQETQELYNRVSKHAAVADVETGKIGSAAVDLGRGKSDLDVVVAGNNNEFRQFYETLVRYEDDIQRPSRQRCNRSYAWKAERYGLPEPLIHTMFEGMDNRLERTGGTDLDLVPSQHPGTWTDFDLPETDDPYIEISQLEAQVIDDEHALSTPVTYSIDTGAGNIDVVTYAWPFQGFVEEGNDVVVSGRLYPAHDTVYLVPGGEYIAPVQWRDHLSR